jgi:citrate lyase subunit beta/citryl-CoA lyase
VRSVLSVPAHDARKVAKARERGADLLMWDLESSVPPENKEVALSCAAETATPGDAVRLNFEHRRGEAARLRDRGLIFVVPHVETFLDIAFLEGEQVVALVESPRGITYVRTLTTDALHHPAVRLAGLAFGRWDFEGAVGFPCPALVDHARAELALAAHSLDITCWDAPALLRETAVESIRARHLGFTGKGCIHPAQIADVHRAWSSSLLGWRSMPFAAKQFTGEGALSQ